jgi:hypothetical protein
MSTDIDWVMVIFNSPITDYLDKYRVLGLSLTNKRIRAKLYPKLFNYMIINETVLSSFSSYFDQWEYFKFDNLAYMEKLQLTINYGFSRELAFKEIQIDPFIEEAVNTLNGTSSSMHCKALEFSNLERACYFIFPIFCNNLNLNKLILCSCDIPFIKLYNLLIKLENLEELDMRYASLILNPKEASNPLPNLQLPKSLTKLTYRYIRLGITDYPEARPLQFLRDMRGKTKRRRYRRECLNLLPQCLPNLKSLLFYNWDWNVTEFEKFLEMCPVLENVDRPRF